MTLTNKPTYTCHPALAAGWHVWEVLLVLFLTYLSTHTHQIIPAAMGVVILPIVENTTVAAGSIYSTAA